MSYEDKDFGNQFFSLTSTADLYDKATLKVIRIETVTLDLQPLDTSRLSTLSSLDNHSASTSELDFHPANEDASSPVSDSASCSSKDTIILPDSCRSATWPVPCQIPEFSHEIKLILAEANRSFQATGIPLRDASVKSAIMHDLSKVIFSYSAYPSNEQITSVSYALVEKFQCLKEPGSFAGLYGWQQQIKNKMHNYCAKLKSRKHAFPELEVNTLRRKCPADAHPAKNVKKTKKAEVNYLPPHPVGENQETLEK